MRQRRGDESASDSAEILPSARDGSELSLPEFKSSDQVNAYQYAMPGHAEQCVERYLELAKMERSNLKNVDTPCLDDHQIAPEDYERPGRLSTIAARIVLKALYVAGMSRPDILWSVIVLAREVTTWNQACDKRLHRSITYLNCTKEFVHVCYVGDSADTCELALFDDAGFAGDLNDSRSTSGGILFLVGPNTFVPIPWLCKSKAQYHTVVLKLR